MLLFLCIPSSAVKYERISVKLSLFDNKDISAKGDIVFYKRCLESHIYWLQLASKAFKAAFKKDNSIIYICEEQILIIQSEFGGQQELNKGKGKKKSL